MLRSTSNYFLPGKEQHQVQTQYPSHITNKRKVPGSLFESGLVLCSTFC